MGVGSPLRSDDAAGLHVAIALQRTPLPGVTVFETGPVPENFTSEVRRLRPASVILVDCARMGEAPGTLRLISPEEIAGVSFGTHGMPLSILAGFLRSEVGCTVHFLGIEPWSTEPGEGLSPPVRAAVAEAAHILRATLSSDSENRS